MTVSVDILAFSEEGLGETCKQRFLVILHCFVVQRLYTECKQQSFRKTKVLFLSRNTPSISIVILKKHFHYVDC